MRSRRDAYARPVIVGRDRELGILRRLCRSAAAGAGGAALVEGAAGVGKSTLLRELTAQTSGVATMWGRAPEEGGAPPYWPWREIAGTAGWSVDWSAAADRWSLWAQVASAARQAADAAPLLLVLDDLHAADDDTVQLTGYLARSLQDAPVALVIGARPADRLAPLARACTLLTLFPLERPEAERVIDEHAVRALDAQAREAILEVAEGNPLLLRELARTAGATGIPREVRTAVEQRLGPLEPAVRQLVGQAAVLGRSFDLPTLARLSGRPQVEVLAALEPLQAMGLIEADGLRRSFHHQLVRDVVYAGLPEQQRLLAHRQAAEAVGPGRPALTAEHLLSAVPAVAVERAVQAAREAAREAARSAAHGERAALLARALSLTGPAEAGLRLDLLLELGAARLAAGQVRGAAECYDEAVLLATARQDEARRADALLGRTARFWTGTAVADELPALADASERARSGGDLPRLVRLLIRRAELHAASNDPRSGRALAEAALDCARRLDEPDLLAAALSAVHVACWSPDGEERAAQVGAELARVVASGTDPDRQLDAALASMVDALRAGDLAALDLALDRAAAVADRSGSLRHAFFVLSRRATRALMLGRLAEAAQLLQRARVAGEAVEEPDVLQVFWGAQFLVLAELNDPDELLAMADWLSGPAAVEPQLRVLEANFRAAGGQVGRAGEMVADVLEHAVSDRELASGNLAWGVVAARVAVAAGDAALCARVERVLAPHRGRLVVNAGAVTFCGMVDHWLGLLAACQGRTQQAEELLVVAGDRYRAMGATWFVRAVDVARSGLGRLEAGAARREAVLRPVSDGWEVGWCDATVILPDARGLQHLHALLAAAGAEVHAADLVAPGSSALVTSQAREALLDESAKRAYRQRIRALQDAVAGAEQAGEVEAVERAQAELDALVGELRRAVGLGGRDRFPPDGAERARVAVRKAVVASLTRLAEHAPSLAAHLRTSVHTGVRCAYVPDPVARVDWVLH